MYEESYWIGAWAGFRLYNIATILGNLRHMDHNAFESTGLVGAIADAKTL